MANYKFSYLTTTKSKIKYKLLRAKDTRNWKWRSPLQLFIIVCVFIIICVFITVLYTRGRRIFSTVSDLDEEEPQPAPLSFYYDSWFVNTTQCKIPYVDPFTDHLRTIYHPHSYEDCAKDDPFITSPYDSEQRHYILHMNTLIIDKYLINTSSRNITCCYRQIVRNGCGDNVDSNFSLLPCTIFHQDFIVPLHINYIITECYDDSSKKLLQQDAFSFIQYRGLKIQWKKPSILILGVDSLSRINLRRTMPNTFKYFQMNDWFELQGYNKIGDNTFPNLMALLTSYNGSTADAQCIPESFGGLDSASCNFIWRNFHEFGYRTAYAEDCAWLSTFNYMKKGFVEPPTDYYLRPMMLAIEKHLNVIEKEGLPFCIGRKHYAEYIYDYAMHLANVYKDEPYFGFFWANTFSHNSFDTPSTMDVKLFDYLLKMEEDGVFERAIVFFLSDHGVRWGPLLFEPEGFLEERLPTMFLSLPAWYRTEHPEFVKALQVNCNRLTSPFDIYATLRQILVLDEPKNIFPQYKDTTVGINLFNEVPENRTCLDAGISTHWCTCMPFLNVGTIDIQTTKIVKLVVEEMNQYLAERQFTSLCSTLTLHRITTAEIELKEDYALSETRNYRILFSVYPEKSRFQATPLFNKTEQTIKINVEDMTRLDSYESTSRCVHDKEAKKYCICKDLKSS